MGALRLLLALCVVAGHAQGDILGIPLPDRFYAVQAFFIISGFYMAMILSDGYRGANGVRNFYATRVMRIFTLYFLGVALAIAVNLLDHSRVASLEFYTMTEAGKWFYRLSNFFIVNTKEQSSSHKTGQGGQ